MPLVNIKDMVDHAYRHNYAVPSFALVNLEFLQGVMAAAERCRAPVILGLRESPSDSYDFDLLVSAAEYAAQRASVPVAIHMHHGADIQSSVRAINGGCNGVMVDASYRELGDNIGITREVVAMARACGVPVEGNLGYMPEADGVTPDANELTYTAVAEARGYVEKTGVDFLAVSIGTMRGCRSTKPRLNWQRLKHLNETLTMPLTIYGGSGLTQSQHGRLVVNGVAKIDYFTALADAAFERLRANARGSAKGRYTSTVRAVQEAVEQETENRVRSCSAAGRAAEVLAQCRHWTPIEHLVTHDVHGLPDSGVEAVMEEGRRILSEIPGVRGVCSGKAEREDETLRYSWLVRFCNAAAVDSYREHPAYVAFAGRRVVPDARPAGRPGDRPRALEAQFGPAYHASRG